MYEPRRAPAVSGMLRPHYRLDAQSLLFGVPSIDASTVDVGSDPIPQSAGSDSPDEPRAARRSARDRPGRDALRARRAKSGGLGSAFSATLPEKRARRMCDHRVRGAKVRRSCKLLILGYLAESCSQIFA